MALRFSPERWRRRLPPDAAAALAELERLAGERAELRAAAACHAELVRRLFSEPLEIPAPEWRPDAATKLAEGRCFLSSVPVDWGSVGLERRWLDVCRSLRGQPSAAGAAALAEAVRRRRVQPAALAGALFADHSNEQAALPPDTEHPARADHAAQVLSPLAGLGLDDRLAGNILRLTLLPLLAHWCKSVFPVGGVPTDPAWGRGHCPFCGSWPLLAELRGLAQARRLRCGLCAADWPADRVWCPFCGQRDARQLGYLHVEGESHYRIETCQRCRRYVKTLSRLEPLSPPSLLVADLATVHLDVIAQGKGFLLAD